MAIVLEQFEGKSCIRLDGSIDVSVAEELKASFLDALAVASEVLVDCRAATYLDVTAVQILWAARIEAVARRTPFAFVTPIPAVIASCLAGVGLEHVLTSEMADAGVMR